MHSTLTVAHREAQWDDSPYCSGIYYYKMKRESNRWIHRPSTNFRCSCWFNDLLSLVDSTDRTIAMEFRFVWIFAICKCNEIAYGRIGKWLPNVCMIMAMSAHGLAHGHSHIDRTTANSKHENVVKYLIFRSSYSIRSGTCSMVHIQQEQEQEQHTLMTKRCHCENKKHSTANEPARLNNVREYQR